MSKTYLSCLSFLLLTACASPNNELPNPSQAQEKAAFEAYTDLQNSDYDAFLLHLDPNLQSYFKENEKVMRKFSHSIPNEAYKSKTLMTKKIETDASGVEQYKVSYEITYPKNLVQYDVSFDRAQGDSTIKNFNVRVFGE